MRARKFDVFLSYHNNDQQIVEILARKLKSRGLKPWLAVWNLVPGETWQRAMEEALTKCISCAVCLGAGGLGPWQSEEMRAAIDRRVSTADGSFRVIPVLLPGTKRKNGLPAFLSSATWVEFSQNINDERAVDRLVSGIRGRAPGDRNSAFANETKGRIDIAIRVSGTPEQFKRVSDAAEEFLRNASGDASLTIKYIRSGSVIVVVNCTEEGFQRLESLFESGQFAELMGWAVEGIQLEGRHSHGMWAMKGGIVKSSRASGQLHHVEGTLALVDFAINPDYAPPPSDNLSILIKDKDRWARDLCKEVARSMEFEVYTADNSRAALRQMEKHPIDVVLLDVADDGLELLAKFKEIHPHAEVVMVSAQATVDSIITAMKSGASDFIRKPFKGEELKALLTRAAKRLRKSFEDRMSLEHLQASSGYKDILGLSAEMQKLNRIIDKVASSRHPVLIQGESGTGKEVVAHAIHANGPFFDKPFLLVDCAPADAQSLENELFAPIKAATRADQNKGELFALASGGTIFFDEIGEMPLDVQSRLVRTLQEREFLPQGSSTAVPVNVRIVAATSGDLEMAVQQGTFRRDLFFRLNVVSLRLPPLRERKEDISVLADHFLKRIGQTKQGQHSISSSAMKLLLQYDWPGNVRELENCLERAVAMSSGLVLHDTDFPPHIRNAPLRAGSTAKQARILPLAELEKQAILEALQQLNGDKLMTARALGLGKTTLYRKMKEYGIAHWLLEKG